MAISIGVPKLEFTFRSAAEDVSARLKNGVVALIIRDEVESPSVLTVVDADDIPATLSDDNAGYIRRALMGSRNAKPSSVYVSLIGPEDDLVTTGAAALAAIDFDYLAGPPDMTAESAAMLMAWLDEARKGYCIGKLVAANYAADNMACVNFAASGIVAGNTTYPTGAYCSRIAGILASTDLAASATYAPLTEVSAVDSIPDPDAAVDTGKLILLHDGRKAKIARAVNSMATVPKDIPESMRKIKSVETVDLIRIYAIRLAEDSYIGVKANSYDNKLALVADLQAYLTELESLGVISSGTGSASIDYAAQRAWLKANGTAVDAMTEQEILEANTGSHVFLLLTGMLMDAMEDFKITLTIGGNA